MKSLEEVQEDLSLKRKEVPVGSLWRHIKSDTLYTVKDLVVVESDLTFAVSYTCLGDPSRLHWLEVSPRHDTSRLHWLRQLDEFLDGRFKREVLFKDNRG